MARIFIALALRLHLRRKRKTPGLQDKDGAQHNICHGTGYDSNGDHQQRGKKNAGDDIQPAILPFHPKQVVIQGKEAQSEAGLEDTQKKDQAHHHGTHLFFALAAKDAGGRGQGIDYVEGYLPEDNLVGSVKTTIAIEETVKANGENQEDKCPDTLQGKMNGTGRGVVPPFQQHREQEQRDGQHSTGYRQHSGGSEGGGLQRPCHGWIAHVRILRQNVLFAKCSCTSPEKILIMLMKMTVAMPIGLLASAKNPRNDNCNYSLL